MKKLLLSTCVLFSLSQTVHSQCSTTSAPSGNCNYGINITAFSLAGVASTGNTGCSSGGYGSFASPVRQMTMGIAYPWSANTGGSYNQMGLAIWIDCNNDGQYSASEMLVTDPMATTHSGSLTIPMTATPGTNRSMRVRAAYYYNISGTEACQSYLGYYCETEDYKVDIIQPPPCAGTPSLSSIVSPTYQICNGSSTNLSLSMSYTAYGYQYQWYSSTLSNVGPWTAVSSATLPTFSTPNMTTSTYYTAVVTCTNSVQSNTMTAAQVSVAVTVTNTVPYFEGFEGIAFNNQLPNCSWVASNMPAVCKTYTSTLSQNRGSRTGTRYGAFYMYYTNGSNYFYTNGLKLNAGITYSASMWYKTEYYGYTNVTGLYLMYGSSQSTTGLTNIAASTPAASSIYKSLSGTFTVATSGIYYIAVKSTGNGNYGTNYLSWDDLAVEIPCSLNQTSVTLSATQTTICSGSSINLTASGATTYSWNTGATGSSINETPYYNFNYSVIGTNSLTGCSNTQSQWVIVNPSPNVLLFTDKAVSCSGSPVHLTAQGADTYTWNTSAQTINITVNPTVTTTYTVLGSNAFNCQSSAVQQVSVVALPVVTAVSSAPTAMCVGETQMLTGGGPVNVVTYQWASNSLFIQSAVALISPTITTTYTLTGIDANGCQGKTTFVQNVDACTGINKVTTTASGVKIYPNPSAGFFVVELNSSSNKTVEVTDITGRVIMSTVTKDEKVNVNITTLSNGIYYVRVQSDNGVDVIKVVKQ